MQGMEPAPAQERHVTVLQATKQENEHHLCPLTRFGVFTPGVLGLIWFSIFSLCFVDEMSQFKSGKSTLNAAVVRSCSDADEFNCPKGEARKVTRR